MPTISVDQALIDRLMSKHGYQHDIDHLADNLPLLGTDIDRCDAETLDIEIFPNRPDLLSGETLSRAIRNFIHRAKATPNLEIKAGDIELIVDSELKEIRPIILGAVVRGVNPGRTPIESDAFIKSCLLYTSPSPRDATLSRMPSSA